MRSTGSPGSCPTACAGSEDGLEEEVARGAIVAGDMLRVLEGERIPADSRIRRGLAFVDEQVLTGESTPGAPTGG